MIELTPAEAVRLARAAHADPALLADGTIPVGHAVAALWTLAALDRAVMVALMEAVYASPEAAIRAATSVTLTPSWYGGNVIVVRCGHTRTGVELFALVDEALPRDMPFDDGDVLMVVPA